MTTPVTPVADASLPLPDPADLGTWGARMAEMHRWMREALRPGMNDLADDTYTNAIAASASANFQGLWSGLTGPLLLPATVSHDSKVWLLLRDLTDVTTETPGVSGAWLDITTLKAADVVQKVGGAARLPSWTTAGRPVAPAIGDTGFNTTLGVNETWNTSEWLPSGKRAVVSSVVSVNSGTAHDLASIPDWVDELEIVAESLSLTDTGNLLIQLGVSGGVVTAGYVSTSAIISGAATSATSSSAGLVISNGAAARAFTGSIRMRRNSNKWSGEIVGRMDTTTIVFGSGIIDLTGVLTTIRITRTSEGSFDGAGGFFVIMKELS